MSDSWKYRQIDHTADLSIEVRAASMQELFEHALEGMTSLLLSAEKLAALVSEAPVTLDMNLDAPDYEVLLVDMLNRINLESSLGGIAFTTLQIEELEPTKMQASATGYVTNSRFEIDIKAVTYHGLKIKKDANGAIIARILFDI